ncbi:MAG: flagellar hook-associated protein FlgK [Lachnospiraceae bacterium]|nr:flagellar hook-associated protein FlgK [Lachnospiraceae bacterium]MDY3222613.1 flagellar hook-associated protein FlgK [Lachnospiraceae bacterium]
MPSQFFGLTIGYSGLLAANAALNTTGNNISNVETDGYSRQKVNQSAADALRVFTTYGCAGAGVEVLAIERIRDEFYDVKYWNNNTNTGEYSMKAYYMKQVEDYFADNSTIEGFKTIFDRMMSALAEVQKQSGSDSTKAQFIGSASSLCDYFNSMAANMEQVQKDVNQEIKLKIDEINSIATEIAALNKQINTIELDGKAHANELRDARTKLLDELSAIVDVEVTETPIVDATNPDRYTGANRLIVRIAGGQTLVDTGDYRSLECVARKPEEKVNQSDIDGIYDVYWVANRLTGDLGDQFNLYNGSMGGELRGLVQMRDGNNGENFQGTVNNIQTVVDGGVTYKDVTVKVTKDYLLDMNKLTLSDTGGKINLGNQVFYFTEWKYDQTTQEYTFRIDESINNANLTTTRMGKEATIGASVKYQGVPYYMAQMNEWIRTFSEAFNKILKEGYDVKGNQGILMFTGNHETDEEQYQFNQGLGNGKNTVSVNDDSYYRLTAKNASILKAMVNDPDLLATKMGQTEGVDEYKNVERLIKMINDKTQVSFRGASTAEFLTCILSDIALNTNSANTFHSNFTNVGKAIDNQRLSISGVDQDEEAVNLVKYQNAYNLASRMIQTMTEIYDRLILQTGV